jgi:hypothetical protein
MEFVTGKFPTCNNGSAARAAKLIFAAKLLERSAISCYFSENHDRRQNQGKNEEDDENGICEVKEILEEKDEKCRKKNAREDIPQGFHGENVIFPNIIRRHKNAPSIQDGKSTVKKIT